MTPLHTKLTEWLDTLLRKCDSLTRDEKKLYIRQANVYSPLSRLHRLRGRPGRKDGRARQHADHLHQPRQRHLGRRLADGTPSEVLQFNGVELPAEAQMTWYDVWGTDQTYLHFAVAWASAFATPFKSMKQIPAYFGGMRQGMAISWPRRSRMSLASGGSSTT